MSSKSNDRIFWLNDAGDVNALPPWLDFRSEHVTDAVALYHDDTGATSIALFNGEDGAGIIRCANDDLTEVAIEYLSDFVDVVYGEPSEGNRRNRRPAPKKSEDWRD